MSLRTHYRLVLLGLLTISGLAQPVPKLNSISREWIQRGTKANLTLSGENLTALKEIVISGSPGVTATLVPAETSHQQIESDAAGIDSVTRSTGDKAEISLELDPHAALTDREIRLVSENGVSNPLTVHVSPYRETDSANNRSRETAEKIELPTAVNGTIDTAAQSHFFRFNAKEGQRLIAEVFAARSGSKLDSSVAIYDSAGKELARNEDAVGLDSVLDFKVPADGEYTLEIRDFRYQGGGEFRYRMVVGVLPHVTRAFPFGGQRGQTIDLTLEGENLDSSKLSLHLAADAARGRQEIRASSAAGLSNPFALEVSDLPDFNESEPNSALDQADRISIPVAINGRINQRKDYDAFRFHAAAEQRIVFEVNAYRHGSRLDALLTLTDDTGKVLLRNDDAAGEDARIDYTFKQAGDYFIILEDLLGRGGDDFGYRLTAVQPHPDFSLVLARDTQRLHRGGHAPIRCEVNRMNGFDGPVAIACEGLPSGVHADTLFLPPGVSAGYLVLTADNQAPVSSFPLKVVGHSSTGTRILTHEAEPQNNDKNVKQAFLTVLNPAPFQLFPATLMANLEQNQSGEIEVMIERRNGFNGEVKISPEGFSAGREPISKSFDVQPLTLKAGETRGKVSLKTKTDSEIGIRYVMLRGESENAVADYSPLIPVAATQIPFVLSTSLKKLIVTALPESNGSAAAEAVFNAKVDRRDGFEDEIKLTLEGVPPGVSATVTNIAAKTKESVIRLVASEKAPTGTNVTLTLTATGQHKDRIYHFQAPALTLTINAAESDDKKDEPKLANKQ